MNDEGSGSPALSLVVRRPAARARPDLPRLARVTLNDDVYHALRHALMSGRFRPGEQLTLRELSGALGTSLIPVRDAVGRLVAEGALAMLPNRSAVLPEMTRDRLRQVYRIREALDSMLVGDAARRITPSSLKKLEVFLERMEQDRRKADIPKYIEHNQAFHFTIYAAAGEAVLLRVMETLWLQIGPFIRYCVTELRMAPCNDYHRAALDALRRGDAGAACKAMTEDLIAGRDIILQQLPDPASSPAPAAASKTTTARKPRTARR